MSISQETWRSRLRWSVNTLFINVFTTKEFTLATLIEVHSLFQFQFATLYCIGDMPVRFLKTLLKCCEYS